MVTTFQNCYDEVKLNLGISDTADPIVSGGIGADILSRIINRAPSALIKLAVGANKTTVNLFPELESAWSTSTSDGDTRIARPANLLTVYDVKHSKGVAVPNDYETIQWYEVPYVDKGDFALLDKNQSGYPSLHTRTGIRVRVWPVPSSSDSTTTPLLIFGHKRDDTLSVAADTLEMDEIWAQAWIAMSTALGAKSLKMMDDAASWLRDVQTEVAVAADFYGVELLDVDMPPLSRLDWLPSMSNVYGRFA